MKGVISQAIKGMDPTMLSIGLLFLGTWWTLGRIEKKIDRIKSGLSIRFGNTYFD